MTCYSRPFAALGLVLLLTAGCGQRGPLYLPGDPNEGRIEIPGQEQEEDADENEQTDSPPARDVADD